MRDSELRLERSLDKYLGTALVLLLAPFLRSGSRALAPNSATVRRILLIKLHGIGNVVMVLPALRAIREQFPDAEIDFLTFQSNAPVIAGERAVAAGIFISRTSTLALLRSVLRLLPKLRHSGYDLVVDFEQFANISAILAALTGARTRIGFRNLANKRDLLFTIPVAYMDTAHMSRIFMKLARAAAPAQGQAPSGHLTLDDTHVREAIAFEQEQRIGARDVMVIVHPGSSANLTVRRWPAERVAAVADRLMQRFGAKIVLTGDSSEQPLAGCVAQSMASPPLSAVGRLSLKGLAALCERAELVISNDTALVHIASAMGTPVVGLYGPNTPFLYGPVGREDLVFYHELPCSPCLVNINAKISGCRAARCMDAITVEEVAAGIADKYFDPDGTIKKQFKKERPPSLARP